METFKLFPDQVNELNETQEAILRHYNPLVQAPAGSGKTFQMMALINWENARNGRVLYMVHRKEIVKQVEEKFFQYGVQAIVKTTYWLQRTKNYVDGVTMLITDESHHSEAKGYKDIYERYSQAIHVGYTATPARMDGQGFEDTYDKLIVGPTVTQLISEKRLSNFQLWGYDLGNQDALKRQAGRDFSDKIVKEYFGNTKSRVIFGDILHSWEKHAKDKQTIVYCYSVDFAKQIATMFNKAGYKAACVYSCSSAKEKEERAKNIADFENGRLQVLTNYDVIGEGFDVTNCSCTVLLRPTMSLTVYIQQAMRSMRYKPGKTATIIDQVGNFMRFGRPDKEWDWNLESSPEFSLKGKPVLKSCPECHITCPIQTTNCPNCGYRFPIEKKHDEFYDVRLQLIKKNPRLKKWIGKNAGDAKTVQDFVSIERANNEKPGWGFRQAIKAGILNKNNFPQIDDFQNNSRQLNLGADRGVNYIRPRNRWQANITFYGHTKTKAFIRKEDAVAQRKRWEKQYRPAPIKPPVYGGVIKNRFVVVANTGFKKSKERILLVYDTKSKKFVADNKSCLKAANYGTGRGNATSSRHPNIVKDFGRTSNSPVYYVFTKRYRGKKYAKSFKDLKQALDYRDSFLKEHNLPIPKDRKD